MDTILIILVLLGIAGAIYYYFDTQATKDGVTTTLPASQIVRQAVQEIGTERRWTATGHSSDYASFTFKQHANCGIAIIFTFFFVVPGILYFLIASRTQTLNISVFPESDETSSVQISASGGDSKRRGKRFLRGLPQQPTVTPQQAKAPPSAAPEGAALTVGDQPRTPDVEAPTEAAPRAIEDRSASPESTSGRTELTAETGKAFCEHCGAEMLPSHRFCPSCGKGQAEGP